MTNNNQQAFFELLRAGLWEKDAHLLQYKDIDYSQVLRLAETQAVVGLVAAGIENVVDVKVPKENVLQLVGQTLQIELRNNDNFYGEPLKNAGRRYICLLVKVKCCTML